MLFPLRVEDAAVDRTPVVSLAIAGICALAFVVSWVVPKNPDGIRPDALMELVQYYEEHPYLEVPDSFARAWPQAQARFDEMHEDAPATLDAATRELEQKHFESLVEDFEAEANASTLRRFALVPARGLLQPGWLTSMFLHFGWLHILGNLFFFYLTGPLLEDLWGRRFFGGFYLVGGLVAALAHFALDPHSPVPMAGASGAIAACMGAFSWRCATRKIRMAYWFGWFVRGTFLMPAWLWGGFWFACEVFSFATHSSGGVAVMAHIGGFLFGLGSAVALEKSGYEARSLAPAVQGKTTWTQHHGTDAAREALERGDKMAAAEAYRAVLKERPQDREAAVGLARHGGDAAPALALVQSLVTKGDGAHAWEIVVELGEAFDPDHVSERLAWQLAAAAQHAPEGAGDLPDRLDLAIARRGGALAPKALLRAAKRAVAAGRQDAARSHIAAARELPNVPMELLQQLDAIAAHVAPAVAAPPAHPAVAPVSAAAPAPAPAGGAVRILACKLLRLAEDALHLESAAGQQRRLEFNKVVGVGAAVVKTAEGPAILTDFVLSWGDGTQGPAAVRIAGPQLGLPALFPGLPAKDAYARFLGHILARTVGELLPSRDALAKGEYPKFQSVAALNAAFYGRARS